MQIIPYEQRYAQQIATLLNTYLPFEEESAQTVHEAGGVRFICVMEEEVIGYIAGYPISSFQEDFPYFEQQLQQVKVIIEKGTTYYSSHFVVNPTFRKMGIGTKLVDVYIERVIEEAKAIVTVGWVQSDTNEWAAKKQFEQRGFKPIVYIPRYFEPYDVYCPNCNGTCYCDAHIYARLF